jgi:hypothetical protein
LSAPLQQLIPLTRVEKPKSCVLEDLSRASYLEPDICWKSWGVTIASHSGNCFMPCTHWSSNKYCHPHRAPPIHRDITLYPMSLLAQRHARQQYSTSDILLYSISQVSLLILGSTLRGR